MSISNLIFKYGIYYPVILLRGEWIGRHLKALEETQYASQDQIERLQLERLNRLLQHARLIQRLHCSPRPPPGKAKLAE